MINHGMKRVTNFILRQSHAVHPRPQSIPNIPNLPGMDRNGSFWLGLLFTSVFFGDIAPTNSCLRADFGMPIFVTCTRIPKLRSSLKKLKKRQSKESKSNAKSDGWEAQLRSRELQCIIAGQRRALQRIRWSLAQTWCLCCSPNSI